MNSFANRKTLAFTITLGAGTFGSQGNSVRLTGLRAVVDIQKAGGQMMSTATIRIYGVPLDMMNQLATLAFLPLSYVKNTVQVDAIEGDALTTVFTGDIIKSFPDFQSAPDVCLYMETQVGYSAQVTPVAPLSYPGTTAVTDILKTIADQLGVPLKNNGVDGVLENPYLPGSTIDQLRAVAQASNTAFYLDDGVLAIAKPGIAIQPAGGLVPLVNKDTGLVGYPTFDKIGVQFSTLFNPSIRFGSQIMMQSGIKQADGLWQVCAMNYRLESEKPGGAWFQTIQCTGNGLVVIK